MKKVLLFSLLIINEVGFAQKQDTIGWSIVKEVLLKSSPSVYSIDTESNIYVGFDDGSLHKYSSKGELSPPYSLPNQSSITLIEAINNRKIFLFYRDIQKISILDRFSSIPKTYNLADYSIYFAQMACPSPDGTIWVLENNPQRLLKIDPIRSTIIHEIQFQFSDDVSFMRSYQNLLLLSDHTGIYILDQFGNLIQKLDLSNTYYLQLLDGKIIASTEENYMQIDLNKSETIPLLLPNKPNGIMISEEHCVFIEGNKVGFYSK